MEANTEEFTMYLPHCHFARPHQKRVSDAHLINQNLQNLAFNTLSSLDIYVILPPSSLQIVANQMHQTPSLLFHHGYHKNLNCKRKYQSFLLIPLNDIYQSLINTHQIIPQPLKPNQPAYPKWHNKNA